MNTLQTHSGTHSSQRCPGFPTLECLTSRPPLRSVPLVLVSVIHTPPSFPLVSSQWAVDTNLLPGMTRSMSAVSKRRERERERELRCDKQERGRFSCYILVSSPDLIRRVYHFHYNARDTESDPHWGWFWVWDRD